MNTLSLKYGNILTCVTLLAVLVFAAPAQTQEPVPAFGKVFSPSTIGPGSVATLLFTITNQTASPVSDLAFTDALPSGMTIATPASAFTDCTNGLLSAPDGGTTISLSGGGLGALSACIVSVNVIGTSTATNASGDLTSSSGNSGAAEAALWRLRWRV